MEPNQLWTLDFGLWTFVTGKKQIHQMHPHFFNLQLVPERIGEGNRHPQARESSWPDDANNTIEILIHPTSLL